MLVTLEVSKLSGWLNADAYCRESKEGHAGRGEVYGSGGSRRWTIAAASSAQGRARLQIGGRARGGAHREHVVHVRDFGGVEAQRLVERLRVLPRVERRACGAGRGIRVGGQQAVDDRGARSVQERAQLQIGEQGTGRSARRTLRPCS
eukprot:scaffold50683_cov52-Phaeocystis_antarctica.AAC.3